MNVKGIAWKPLLFTGLIVVFGYRTASPQRDVRPRATPVILHSHPFFMFPAFAIPMTLERPLPSKQWKDLLHPLLAVGGGEAVLSDSTYLVEECENIRGGQFK